MTSTQSPSNASEVFAVVQQISSLISNDRVQGIADKAKGLDADENQLIVDLLSMALEKSHHILKNADCVFLLLKKIASSAGIVARNRIINSECITSDEDQSPGLYRVLGDQPGHVKVVSRGRKNISQAFSEDLIAWAHFTHLNILPVYGVFLEGKDKPVSLISPQMTKGNIIGYAKSLAQTDRMLLISDVLEGLCYLHSLNVVHGALKPQNIILSNDGQALITGFRTSSEPQDLESYPGRYSAPEVLEDDTCPTTASDIWSLGCLIYEVLSGKIPFYQIRQEIKVGAAIAAGKKPVRPSAEETGVEEISDTIWRPTFACWESEANDRPTCWQLQKSLSSIVIRDDRPVTEPTIERAENSSFKLNHAKSILMQLVESSDLPMPPPSKIPEHLQQPLFGLVDSVVKAETVAVAAQKLSGDDAQILIDVLDLMIEENPSKVKYFDPPIFLSRKIMLSTHIFPQRYKINRIRYDPTPIAEGYFGKVYKGRDLNICIVLITMPRVVADVFEFFPLWAHSSHPNFLPLYGVFQEASDELPQFCLVLPCMKNGLLRDYAPRLPQQDRLPLILDIISALVFLKELNVLCNNARGDNFLISEEGRAFIDAYMTPGILASTANSQVPELYSFRFYSPERAMADKANEMATVWSFGCLVYEVLSRKPPYHQYTEESELRAAVSRGEVPRRPSPMSDGDIDEIGDQFWDLIMGCCVTDPADRLSLLGIQGLLADMGIQDNRPKGTSLPGVEALALRPPPDINWGGVKPLLDKLQVELLRPPLSKLIQNPTKEVATAVVNLTPEDVRTLVDFLDLALKNHITLSDERNRVLALLSRVTTLTHIFPRRYELKGIKYGPLPIAEGGYGTVHRGTSDPNLCVKVMTKVDPNALMGFIKELILWAHASHPNVLPFYGVFLSESKRICLVSPFMIKGNLHDYAPRLAQKDRIPLLHDVIKGLVYLHGLGVVHTDLKGENVLISDEGHGLISDFGASHVITATAKGGATTASVASTLRFTAPEIVLDRRLRPVQECDIWSFGCLCYEVLSRKLPYFEYSLEAQIYAALARKQLPKRPSSADDSADDDDGWDASDDWDWDEIDEPGWSLITKCCTPKPEDRPKASQIQELIVDLKIWDVRPEANDISDAYVLSSLRSPSEVNLNRAGELLNELQCWLLAQMALQYPTEDVISAVSKLDLDVDDARTLTEFWDLVLNHPLFASKERNNVLALLSALTCSTRLSPRHYTLESPIAYNRSPIGRGWFGTAHRGIDINLCIKVSIIERLNPDVLEQRRKSVVPLAYSSHPNLLPFYGFFWIGNMVCSVFPFMENGNLYNHPLRLPQKSRLLLISDVVEAVMYLNSIGIVHGNLKGENVLISNEGRALVADFRPYHANLAAAEDAPTGSYVTSTLRFTAPELVKASQTLPTAKSDIWSIGCLIYLVLSRKIPFYQYSKDTEIRTSLSRGEPPTPPVLTDNGAGGVDDQSWDLISKCCAPEPDDRFTFSDIQKWLASLGIQDNRPPAKPLPTDEIPKLADYGVDGAHAGEIMSRIISELLPISQDGEKQDWARDQSTLDHLTSPII